MRARDCSYGGDVDHRERNCQNPSVIAIFGLETPLDVATVVTVDYCQSCIFAREVSSGNGIRTSSGSFKWTTEDD